MLLKTVAFNHETSDIDEALNIPESVKEAAMEKIIFSSVSNSLIGHELYEDEDERPAELRTVTGDLQKTLSLVTDPLEYEFILLKFLHYHQLIKHVMSLYVNLNYNISEESRKEAQQIKKLFMMKELLKSEDDDKKSDALFSFNQMYKKIDMVKKSKYNFTRYMEYVSTLQNDNDDLLKFLKDDDED